MRRRASEWAVETGSLEKGSFRSAERFGNLEGSSDPPGNGRGAVAPGEVSNRGTPEGDDPETWETRIVPPELAAPGEPHPNLRVTCVRERRHGWPREDRSRRSARQAVGRRRGKTGAEAEGDAGVGGPHSREDVGERLATGPGRAKAARVETNFRREP
jgi:hypothetical protein